MMRVCNPLCAYRGVTLDAHLVGVVAEFQRSGIRRCVGRMGIVTARALRQTPAETGGTQKRFADERRFAKSSVAVKGACAKLGKGLAQQSPVVRRLVRVVHLPVRTQIAESRLAMALAADERRLYMVHLRESQRRHRVLRSSGVQRGGSVTHLAI